MTHANVGALRARARSWRASPGGRAPAPFVLAAALFPLVAMWTLPQTLAGIALAAHAHLRGVRGRWYRFGPFLFYVVPTAPPASRGISLGVVVLADDPSILTHELCHLYTGLWLAWLYLPVYGLEYALLGHDRSPHERATVRFESRCRLAWQRIGDDDDA
jgi:hypothetical protein